MQAQKQIWNWVSGVLMLGVAVGCAAASDPEPPPSGSLDEAPSEMGDSVLVDGRRALVEASSVLASQGRFRYGAAQAVDENRKTAWVEGGAGAGAGETLTVDFGRPVQTNGFALVPGYVKSGRAFVQNATPRRMRVRVDGDSLGAYTIPYDVEWTEPDEGGARPPYPDCYHIDSPRNRASTRIVWFERPQEGERVQLTVTQALLGANYADLAITEWIPLALEGTGSAVPHSVRAVLQALRSPVTFDTLLAPGAHVEDLRRVYIGMGEAAPDIQHRDDPPTYHTASELARAARRGQLHTMAFPYFARVEQDERRGGDTAADRFLHYVAPVLLNGVLTMHTEGGTTYLLGPPSVAYGNEVGGERYPLIALNEQGRVTTLREVSRYGRRLCENVLPEIRE